MDYTFNINVDKKILSSKSKYNFVFFGFEDKDRNLIKRFEISELNLSHSFSFQSDVEPKWCVIWPNDGDWLTPFDISLPQVKVNKESTVTVRNYQKKILYIGQCGTSGYANAAKGYIAKFLQDNHLVHWVPLKFDDSKDSDNYVDRLCQSSIINNVVDTDYQEVYLHCTCDLWPQLLLKYKKSIESAKKIGVSVWETDRIPAEWINPINKMDILEVPSTFNKEIYEKDIIIPIEVKPHIFHKQRLPEKVNLNFKTNNHFTYNKDKFTFYNISEFNNRKGLFDAIKIFSDVYGDRDDVQFLIKTHFLNYKENNIDLCLDRVCSYIKTKNIGVFVKNFTNNELLALHSAGDCYISLNRGEGFGLVIQEAFEYGNKVLTTGWSGHLDFLGKEYPYLVDYELENVDMGEFNSKWYNSKQKWAKPNLDHAKELLTKIYK